MSNVQHKSLRLAIGWQRHHRCTYFLPVHQDHREDRAGLDGDVEHLGFGIVKPQQGARQNQMAGGRNGQELGQSLDDPHDGGLDQQYNVHTHSFKNMNQNGL